VCWYPRASATFRCADHILQSILFFTACYMFRPSPYWSDVTNMMMSTNYITFSVTNILLSTLSLFAFVTATNPNVRPIQKTIKFLYNLCRKFRRISVMFNQQTHGVFVKT
jgi:hypothetical protein